MERGFSENQISNGVYVYVDWVKNRKTSHPCLYKVKADNTDLIVSEIIKTYPEQNSSSADVFVSALKDAIAFSRKANEQIKGIVLWSHGEDSKSKCKICWCLDCIKTMKNTAEVCHAAGGAKPPKSTISNTKSKRETSVSQGLINFVL